MYQAYGMHGGEPFGQECAQAGHVQYGQRLAVVHGVVHGAAWDVVRGQPGQVGGRVGIDEASDAPRASQGARDGRFSFETCPTVRVRALGADHLHRDRVARHRIREVDLPHPAGAKAPLDGVRPDPLRMTQGAHLSPPAVRSNDATAPGTYMSALAQSMGGGSRQ